jgi:hypothetical protein
MLLLLVLFLLLQNKTIKHFLLLTLRSSFLIQLFKINLSLTNIQPQPNTNTITPYNPYQQQPQAPSPSPYQYPYQQQVQIISASDGSNEIQNGGTTLSTSIIFTFQGGGDTATNSYQCTIDGQGPPYLCKSPVTLTNLAVGSHTIQVNNTIFTWSIVAVDDEEKQGGKVIPDQQTITPDGAV